MPTDLNPSSAALLIADIQPGILAMAPDQEAYLALLTETRAAAREAGLTIGYIRVGLTDEEAAAVPPTNLSFHQEPGSNRLPADSPQTQVDPRIAPAEGEIVVRKRRVGALRTTDLEEQLRARGVDTIVLAGISTSGVILSTVRDAADRDLRVYVLSDACIDRDPEVHRVLTEKVFPRQATVLTTNEFRDLLTT